LRSLQDRCPARSTRSQFSRARCSSGVTPNGGNNERMRWAWQWRHPPIITQIRSAIRLSSPHPRLAPSAPSPHQHIRAIHHQPKIIRVTRLRTLSTSSSTSSTRSP
jgi:hypothetical protein